MQTCVVGVCVPSVRIVCIFVCVYIQEKTYIQIYIDYHNISLAHILQLHDRKYARGIPTQMVSHTETLCPHLKLEIPMLVLYTHTLLIMLIMNVDPIIV